MPLKQWVFSEQNDRAVQKLMQSFGLSPLAAQVLAARNMTSPDLLESMFREEPEWEDPFVLADMPKAVERIYAALERQESVLVYGDYDCDGITSTVILYSYLSMIGAEVSYYIPSREEGYGLSKPVIDRLHQQGISLIITVDNGVSASEEIRYLQELGIECIVTDHHQVGEQLPQAYAVINPHRKDCPSHCKELSGVGVAFKLIAALEQGDYTLALEQYGELAAIGTIGDVVPLVGENRNLVRCGLEQLRHTDHPALRALLEVAGTKTEQITATDVAFQLVPRLNAAGRMQSADLAVRLLLAEDEEEALSLAGELNTLNALRKQQETEILEDIDTQIVQNPSMMHRRVLIFEKDSWPHGIIGITASKILERYGKPVLLVSRTGDVLRGSARSMPGFHLHRALTACASHLIQYGGHEAAAGFQLAPEHFPAFCEAIEQYARETCPVPPAVSLCVDKVLTPQDLSLSAVQSLQSLQPFGAEHPEPLFCLSKVQIEDIIPVSENKHLRLKLSMQSQTVTAMLFRTSLEQFPFFVGNTVDVLVKMQVQSYQNRNYLSMIVQDIRASEFPQQKYLHGKLYYEKFRGGEALSVSVIKKMIPSREQTGVLYRFLLLLQKKWKRDRLPVDLDLVYQQLFRKEINYCQFRCALDILEEMQLIRQSPLQNQIDLLPLREKGQYQMTPTMQKLKALSEPASGLH